MTQVGNASLDTRLHYHRRQQDQAAAALGDVFLPPFLDKAPLENAIRFEDRKAVTDADLRLLALSAQR